MLSYNQYKAQRIVKNTTWNIVSVGLGNEFVLPTVPGHTAIILEFPPGHYPIPTKHLQFASHGKTSGDGEVEEGGGDFQLSGNLQLTCPCRGPSYPSLARYREFSYFQATLHSSVLVCPHCTGLGYGLFISLDQIS